MKIPSGCLVRAVEAFAVNPVALAILVFELVIISGFLG
jgi:hypothetical protein